MKRDMGLGSVTLEDLPNRRFNLFSSPVRMCRPDVSGLQRPRLPPQGFHHRDLLGGGHAAQSVELSSKDG